MAIKNEQHNGKVRTKSGSEWTNSRILFIAYNNLAKCYIHMNWAVETWLCKRKVSIGPDKTKLICSVSTVSSGPRWSPDIVLFLGQDTLNSHSASLHPGV